MDQFTRVNIAPLREAIQKALQEVAIKHDIIITTGGFRYSVSECSTKITCVCAKDTEGKTLLPFEKAYIDMQKFLPDKMKDLGDTFVSNGNVYTICGWKKRNRKYPLLAKRANGEMYKFGEKWAFNG